MEELFEEKEPIEEVEPTEPIDPENPEEPTEPIIPEEPNDFEVEDEHSKEILEKYPSIKTLAKSFIRKVKPRGFSIDNDTAVDEIVDAINAINEVRRFVPTKEQILEEKYYSLCIQLALASISKYGAEGQSSHSENGVGRSYENGSPYPKSLLQSIVPLAIAAGGKRIG